MKINDIMKNTECRIDGTLYDIIDVTFDSRKARGGSLFVCLRGFKSDGHAYAPSAYENGCRAFLVEEKLPLPADATQIICDDTRKILSAVAANFYCHPEKSMHIVGITGTKGKTTTAWLVYSILNSVGKKCGYIGSNGVAFDGKRFETSNTTPESLVLFKYFREMLDCGVGYVVMEVSSQALAHERVNCIPFEITAFTNLYEDHIGEGEHKDFDDYKSSKRRLFSDFNAKHIVANADDPYMDYMTGFAAEKRITFAIESKADFGAGNIEKFRDTDALGVSFDCINAGDSVKVKLLSPGYFSVYNGLCAVAICSLFDVSVKKSAEALENITVDGRFEIVKGKKGVTYIVDYSHNGIALTNALKTLREYSPERLICIFGSVGGRTQGRRKELAEASSKFADYTIITTDNPDFEDPKHVCEDIASHMAKKAEFEIIVDREAAIKRAIEISREGDIVLFAGKGHETYQYIEGKKVPFCEKEFIKKYSV